MFNTNVSSCSGQHNFSTNILSKVDSVNGQFIELPTQISFPTRTQSPTAPKLNNHKQPPQSATSIAQSFNHTPPTIPSVFISPNTSHSLSTPATTPTCPSISDSFAATSVSTIVIPPLPATNGNSHTAQLTNSERCQSIGNVNDDNYISNHLKQSTHAIGISVNCCNKSNSRKFTQSTTPTVSPTINAIAPPPLKRRKQVSCSIPKEKYSIKQPMSVPTEQHSCNQKNNI